MAIDSTSNALDRGLQLWARRFVMVCRVGAPWEDAANQHQFNSGWSRSQRPDMVLHRPKARRTS